jgi:STIP1 family protein 1
MVVPLHVWLLLGFVRARAPAHLLCPITLQVMTDPVITPSGETYERQAIEQWLETHGTDPQTRRPLTKEQLIPNRRLKETVEVHKKTMALTL